MASVIPTDVSWIKAAVAAFEPENNQVILEGCRVVKYKQLVVCPGLKLDWQGIEGLNETLGRNGVTSNYRFDLAPYTWELVQQLKGGRAVFTQPPMPIKCAGAPQKAMYLSSDHWRRSNVLKDIDIQFCNAGAVLFGVADYVPALMEYVKAYGIRLNFGQTLVSVDGPGKKAVFMGVWVLPNANSLDVMKRVRAEVEGLQKELPEQLQARIAYDGTAYIQSAIEEVIPPVELDLATIRQPTLPMRSRIWARRSSSSGTRSWTT